MGSMVLSTLLMFVPQHVELLFFIIIAVGFFGIYVPWNERKKEKNRKESPPAAKLERLEALKEESLLSEEKFEERKKEILGEL